MEAIFHKPKQSFSNFKQNVEKTGYILSQCQVHFRELLWYTLYIDWKQGG